MYQSSTAAGEGVAYDLKSLLAVPQYAYDVHASMRGQPLLRRLPGHSQRIVQRPSKTITV